MAQPLTDTFQVSIGGNICNTTLSGNGAVRKIQAQNIVANVQATFPGGSLIISAA